MFLYLLLIHLCINNSKYVPFLSWFQININSLKCLKAKWSHSRVIVFEGARSLLRCFWCAEWLCKPFSALCSDFLRLSLFFRLCSFVLKCYSILQKIKMCFRTFHRGRCVVIRQKKGKFFPFKSFQFLIVRELKKLLTNSMGIVCFLTFIFFFCFFSLYKCG